MHFIMHESGLHSYGPEDENFVFSNKVTGNKESYSKRNIKADEQAKELYASLGYPSVYCYTWFIHVDKTKIYSISMNIEVALTA